LPTWYIGGIDLPQNIQEYLAPPRYELGIVSDWQSLLTRLGQFDCILFAQEQEMWFRQLVDQGWLIPVVFPIACNLADIPAQIEQAIAQFIRQQVHQHHQSRLNAENSQYNLATKLQERLGYLGVFYKRSPDQFLRNLPPQQKEQQIKQLSDIYRSIVLSYFSKPNADVNSKIDEFTSLAFLADVSMSELLEIHLKLMDDFSKQLKIEGRSDDILADYRITLIDVIAHLCEMYRRSIAKENR